MKKTYFIIACAIISTITSAKTNIELTVSNAQHTKMPIAIVVLDKNNKELTEIAQIIKKDLAFTDQFEPSINTYNPDLTKKELRTNIQQLAHAGTPLALCINAQSPHSIDYHLYDTIECKSLQAKKYSQKNIALNKCAHIIADNTRKILTGYDSLFSSRIAYCKDAKDKNNKTIRKIYVADYDGSNEELIVDSSTMVIAPRWGKKSELFYSEYTDTSVQLKSAEVKKRKKAITHGKNVSHFADGINMMLSFAPNGTDYAFCASQGKGSCQIYLNKDGVLKRCTKNNGNNDSPGFIDSERLYFCSNFQTGSPQIYIGNIETGHLQRITHGGYCTSPTHCPKTNQIAYTKMIHGIMQIMIYDCSTKIHTQQTFNKGNKHEISFSPDGKFLLYSHDRTADTSQLETLNLLTKKTIALTKANDYCTYPHWSLCS